MDVAMTLQQLKYMITVAECGNITEAAERLFIAQPSLTAAIHSLESSLRARTQSQSTPFPRPRRHSSR